MILTPICKLLDIRVPVIQAGMGSYTSAELVAAVTNAGGLGSLGAANRPVDDFRRHLARIGDLTGGSFAVNHAITVMDDEAFQAGLDAHPKVVTLALDHPLDYVARIHDAGALAMHQVTTVQQAMEAAEGGVDIIIAQGGESGGYGGVVSTMPLVPQVVDAVQPVPVIRWRHHRWPGARRGADARRPGSEHRHAISRDEGVADRRRVEAGHHRRRGAGRGAG
jgi:nitronate monooxygenase/enoyl-[acyl-carrier protein] reductase II